MAAFMIGKSLKARRQNEAIGKLFDEADKNGNGRISVREYVKIFSEHGIVPAEDEVRKVSELANENGEVTKDDFLHYAKTSDFFRQQMDKTDGDSVMAKKRGHRESRAGLQHLRQGQRRLHHKG